MVSETMAKQDTQRLRDYRALLMIALPILRNRLHHHLQFGKTRRDTIELGELLHFVPPLLDSEGFGSGDEYFFRVGVSRFLKRYSDKKSVVFATLADHLEILYRHASQEIEIGWEFPKSILEIISRHRDLRKTQESWIDL